MTIRQLLKGIDRKVMTITPTASIGEAIAYLARDDTSALIVTIDDHLVLGILSSSDIVKYLNEHTDFPTHLLVSDLMTHDVIYSEATEKVERLEHLMIKHQVRHIPITDNGILSAMVSSLDIVKFRREAAEKEAGQLRDYVSGVA